METERLRNTLLSSVSHDLRTPLAAITGAASTLLQPAPLDPAAERELKEAIYDEARAAEPAGHEPPGHDAARVGLARTWTASGTRSRSWWERRWPGWRRSARDGRSR